VPHRGARNEPGFVAIVGAFVASLRGLDAIEMATTSSSAAAAAFALGAV
jgi:Tat protein secretion system quality control protein TatD with DNase activity